jgi:ribonuclease P protein component
MPDQRFPKHLRLCSRGDFRGVYEDHRTASNSLLRMLARLTELPHARIGMSVSRKVGNAVHRNRWKRLLREAFRLSREKLPTGLDFVIIPRESVEPELQPLKESLIDLSWKLHKRLKREAATARRAKIERDDHDRREQD